MKGNAKVLKPVQRKTIPDVIVDQIRALIESERFQPGDRLPSERELAEQLRVGRSSVREALKALTSIGLLKRCQRGTYVHEGSRRLLSNELTTSMLLKRVSMEDLFEARTILEVAMSGLAAERATDEDIGVMRECLSRMEEFRDVPGEFVVANLGFHEAIAEAAQNGVLLELFTAVRDLLHQAQEEVVRVPGVVESSLAQHASILSAIQDQNGEAARQTMYEHIDRVRRSLLQRTQAATQAAPGSA